MIVHQQKRGLIDRMTTLKGGPASQQEDSVIQIVSGNIDFGEEQKRYSVTVGDKRRPNTMGIKVRRNLQKEHAPFKTIELPIDVE